MNQRCKVYLKVRYIHVLVLRCVLARLLSRTKPRDKRRCLQLHYGRSRYRNFAAGYMNGRRQKKKWKRTATSSCLKYFWTLSSSVHSPQVDFRGWPSGHFALQVESTIDTYSCWPCKDILYPTCNPQCIHNDWSGSGSLLFCCIYITLLSWVVWRLISRSTYHTSKGKVLSISCILGTNVKQL